MLKPLGFFALWLIGTATAVAVAWTGVAVVDSELVNPAPANTLALRQLDDAGSLPSSAPASERSVDSTDTTTALDTPLSDAPLSNEGKSADVDVGASDTAPITTTESPTTLPSTTLRSTTLPSTTAATPTTAAQTTAPPTTAAAATTAAPPTTAAPTTSAPTTAPPVVTTSTTSSTTTAAPGQVLTFHLVGGSTSISFSPGGATVLWASPNPGFDVDIDHGEESRVEFESDNHKTRIDAWWSGGPRHEIREDAD